MYDDDEQAMRGGELSTRGTRDVSHDLHNPHYIYILKFNRCDRSEIR
jgi:hypothetical protein